MKELKSDELNCSREALHTGIIAVIPLGKSYSVEMLCFRSKPWKFRAVMVFRD